MQKAATNQKNKNGTFEFADESPASHFLGRVPSEILASSPIGNYVYVWVCIYLNIPTRTLRPLDESTQVKKDAFVKLLPTACKMADTKLTRRFLDRAGSPPAIGQQMCIDMHIDMHVHDTRVQHFYHAVKQRGKLVLVLVVRVTLNDQQSFRMGTSHRFNCMTRLRKVACAKSVGRYGLMGWNVG